MSSDSAVGLVLLLVFLVIAFAMFIFWILALVDLLKYNEREYQAADSSKVVWVLVVVLVGGIGGMIYWFTMRTKLRAVRNSGQHQAQFQPYQH